MSDKELEEYLKKIKPNFDSHIEKGTIEMSNEYYNLLEERMVRLLNENKQLKKELEKQNTFGWVLELQDRIDKAIECIHLFGIYKDTPDKGLDIRKILKNILEILGDKE